MSRLIVFALLALAPTVAGQKLGEVPRVAPTAKAPRETTLEWTSDAGRPYWYRLPAKSGRKKPDLVIMLHGTGGNHGWAFWNYGIDAGQFQKDDIVLSPDGVTPGGNATFNFVQNKKDGDQIASLITQFRKQFEIGRVFLYGHSQGAFFCYWFGGAYTTMLDGFIAHAGNVLDVDHNALAKKKLAVCILHGRADAVVPVDCAFRTERIYKEQGYENLKLEIVDGLNERSGHWPLPAQVKKMFEWLDATTTPTARGALQAVNAETAKELPDLATITEALERAKRLVRKAPRDEKESLTTEIDRLDIMIEKTVTAHVAALADRTPKSEDGEWLGHFRAAHAALSENAAWKKAMSKLIRQAASDEKAAKKALKRLDGKWSAKALRTCAKFLEQNRLAASWETIAGRLEQRLKELPKGAKQEDVEAVRELIGRRRPLLEGGAKTACTVTFGAVGSGG